MNVSETKITNVIPEKNHDIINEKQFNNQIEKASIIFEKLKIIYKNQPKILKNIENEYRDVINARNQAKSKESIKGETLIAQEYEKLANEVVELDIILRIIEKYKFKADDIVSKFKKDFGINSEEYKNALIEYNEINQKINEYIKDGKIDNYEFNKVVVEYSDLKKLEYQSKSFISKGFGAIYNVLSETLLENKIDEKNEIIGYKNGEHYIVKISEFEKQIQNKNIMISELNPKALASYLIYLDSKGGLNIDILKEHFGENKLEELGKLWNYKKTETITKKLLKKAGVEKIIDKIISFSNIFKDPIKVTEKMTLGQIPEKESLNSIDLTKIEKFNKENNGACPVFKKNKKENEKKFSLITSMTQTFEIEKKGENDFIEKTDNIIKEKLKNKGLNNKQINEILKSSNNISQKIYNEGLEILKNHDKICGFKLSQFIEKEFNKFLKQNNLTELYQTQRQELSGSIAQTNVDLKENQLQSITETILVLEAKKNKTPEEKLLLKNNKKLQLQSKKDIQKAKQVLETSQATDEEMERFFTIIKNGGTQEEAYNDFKTKKLENNRDSLDEEENFYNKTITKTYKNGEELTYTKFQGGYNIFNGLGKEGINIDKKEFEYIEDNPENLKNLLKFEETLSKLNLDFIWEKRFDYINKINNIDPTLKINIDKKNYINNTELKKILNSIISLSGNEKSKKNDLDSIIFKLKEIGKSGLDENKKDNYSSPIEKIFIKKGIINKNSSQQYFNLEKMKDNY